jgi:hypothetical protein
MYPEVMVRLVTLMLTLVAVAATGRVAAQQQQAPTNLDFEAGAAGELPTGWIMAVAQPQPGISARIVTDEPRNGAQAVLLQREASAAPGASLNLLQLVDATPFRGRRVRFRMAVRTEAAASPAQMWMRIDGAAAPGATPPSLFLDNMDDRPITSQDWRQYEIVADVPQAAARILFGAYLTGVGRAWLDDGSFEVVPRADTAATLEGPKAISRRGVVNLLAFARLLGYVRHFHPSDEAAQTDWDGFAVAAVRAVESSADGAVLTQRLAELFRPIAPSIVVVPSGTPVASTPPADPATRQLIWRHTGFGLSSAQTLYKSERASVPQVAPVFNTEIGGGVSVRIPLSVAVDDSGTLPRGTAASSASAHLTRGRFSMNDRSARLATIVLAWNVFQHSYPYFDAKSNWSAALSASLQEAATDTNEREFVATLRRMVAAVRDGQARVLSPSDTDLQFVPPIALDWVENKLVVTAADAATGAKPGDTVVTMDGTPAPLMLDAAEAFVSAATPHWSKVRAMQELMVGPKDSPIKVRLERGEPAERVDITLSRSVASFSRVPQPEVIVEVQPGILYVDLGRITAADFTAALPRLAAAKGLVFDLRNPPAALGPELLFSHLSDKPVTGPQQHLPQIAAPDRQQTTFVRSGEWNFAPKEPYLSPPKVFLADAHAIGYGESCLAIIQALKLGDIVGSTSAGTNGTPNRFQLPGDYTVFFTGMKVLKPDGSPHHGVGIQPSVPVAVTRAALAAGRDELLEKALERLATP